MNNWIKLGLIALAGTLLGVMVKIVVSNHTAATEPAAGTAAPSAT